MPKGKGTYGSKKGRPPKHLWREVHLKPVEGRIIIFPYYLVGGKANKELGICNSMLAVFISLLNSTNVG